MSQIEFSKQANISRITLTKIESGKVAPKGSTLEKITNFCRNKGLEFLSSQGVKFSEKNIINLSGPGSNYELLRRIREGVAQGEVQEVLIYGLAERKEKSLETTEFVEEHVSFLKKEGITERILIQQGDTDFVGPNEWYKWIPAEHFSNNTFQVYGNNVAIITWGDAEQVTIISNIQIADSFRNIFEFAWQNATEPKNRSTKIL